MTTPERWQEIDRIFAKALDLDPSEREEFLRAACGNDRELRQEVDSLLAHDSPESLVASSAVEEATRIISNSKSHSISSRSIGTYNIIRTLGAGGMGHVYLGHDSRLNRPVAIKLLSFYDAEEEERIRRFRQEALAVSALNHPNILTIYEIGEFEGQHFIVTEYVDGETLQTRIQTQSLALDEAIEISIQISSALSAAHSAGIVHRDIKPANIMLRPDGFVKILDFGIAKQVAPEKRDEHDAVAQTTPGVIVGTAAYMSPEQARGLQIDARSDIWSFGVILFEMLSGRRPFTGETALDVMTGVLHKDPPELAELGVAVPDALQQIVIRALQKDPAGRYQNAGELTTRLKQLKRALEADPQFEAATTKHTTSQTPSVAVMPFVNMSADSDNEYFCDGLSEELSNALSKIEELRVAARTSAFSFKGKSATISAIGRALNVNTVLEGSVRKAGQRLRITVQLTSAHDGFQLWAERYDRDMTDIFDVQDEITLSVVDALKLKLIGAEKGALLKRYTQSVEAYELYLKGRYYWWKSDPAEFVKGKEFFERALEVDPTYALSYCGLSSYYGFGSALGMVPPDVGWPKAIAANARARELDSSLAEVHVNDGGINMVYRRDLAAAESCIKHALTLNPRFQEAHFIYSSYLQIRNRIDEAISEAREAVELDPFSAKLLSQLGQIYYIGLRYDEAAVAYRQAIELDPTNPLLHDALADVFLCSGQALEAIEEFKSGFACRGAPEASERLTSSLALDGVEKTLQLVAQMRLAQLNLRREQGEYIPEIHFVRALAAAGEIEAAVNRFSKACEERNLFPLILHVDPSFSSFAKDPRVAEVLRRSKLVPNAN